MTAVWSALQTSDLAVWINLSRWVYAGIATAHVLAIAVLIGSILILDLRLVGFARRLDVAQLARLVVPVAGTALGCAGDQRWPVVYRPCRAIRGFSTCFS